MAAVVVVAAAAANAGANIFAAAAAAALAEYRISRIDFRAAPSPPALSSSKSVEPATF